jgi:hypothetical protein
VERLVRRQVDEHVFAPCKRETFLGKVKQFLLHASPGGNPEPGLLFDRPQIEGQLVKRKQMAQVRFIPTGPSVRKRFQKQPKEPGDAVFDDLFVEHYLFYPKRRLRVAIKLIERVVGIKIPEGVDREEMPVGRVDKGPAGSKIRDYDFYQRTGFADPVQFLHDSHGVIKMFETVVGVNFVKHGIIEWIRESVKVMDDISLGARVDVDPDHPGLFSAAASKV